MKYIETKPHKILEPFIHSYWELKGEDLDSQWERIFPDGCAGLVMNLGEKCLTDNGAVSMELGKTYVVGAMTSFKDSFIGTLSQKVCKLKLRGFNFFIVEPFYQI